MTSERSTTVLQHLMLLLAAVLLLGACAASESSRQPPEIEPVEWAPLPPAQVTPPPPQATLPVPPTEERIDIDVRDVEAHAFFTSIVRGTRYNMVVHPDVSGRLTLQLADVTVPEVMELVREVYGYEYQKSPRGFAVLPARLQSRIFNVDYLNLQRDGGSRTRVTAGQSVRDALQEGSDTTIPTGSTVSTSLVTDFWAELDLALRGIVGDAPGRSVVLSPQSNLVVVRGLPSELREAEQYLAQVQSNMNRQVIMEAKIVEVQLGDGFQAGINWAALGRPANGKTLTVGQTGGGTLLGSGGGASDIGGQTGDLDPRAPDLPNGTLASAFGGLFSIAAELGDFTAFIELLETQGTTRVLSSPRIATVNNQKAVIKVGSEEFFVTDVSTTTVTGAGATTSSPDITLTPFFSGIALDVTPQINRSGEVVLHIRPAVTSVVDRRKDLTIAGVDQSLPLAFSTVREADSIVRARSGQIVVIGGLMQEGADNQVAQIPALGGVPGLGRAFRQQRRSTSKTELVILLRPVVVDHDGVWEYANHSFTRRDRGPSP